jgi:DNA-binding FadR family transcriptional regulator
MVTTSITSGPDRALEDHAAIIEAICSGDPDRAEAQARKHVNRLRHSLLESLAQEEQS